jgi:tyrosyl-tRNA synthetase
MIGDPSGKMGERPLLSKEQIRENLQRQRDQMARFLEFGGGPTAALLLDKRSGSAPIADRFSPRRRQALHRDMMQKSR